MEDGKKDRIKELEHIKYFGHQDGRDMTLEEYNELDGLQDYPPWVPRKLSDKEQKAAAERKKARDVVDDWIRGGFKGNPWADCEEE